MKTLDSIVPASAFASLPGNSIHWSTFAVSFIAQAALVVFFATTSISFMAPVLQPIDTHESVHLVAPVLEPAPKEPVVEAKKTPPLKPIISKVQAKPPLVAPQPIEVRKEMPKSEVAKVTPPSLTAVAKADALRSPMLASTGSSAPVTLPKPPRQVQTGGFGDPNGVPANSDVTNKGPVIAKVGSFDLPSGPGTGNGRGGNKGVPGTVPSAGFGNGIAGPSEGGAGGKGDRKVGKTNFGNVELAPVEAPKRQAAIVSKDAPVSVLSKPTPSYTLEARQRKIEGDVELEVEFTATGQVHVLRVVQGLGYGLDESAVKAAESIRFAPARRDGQAIDAQGRLKIVFRLS